MANEVGGPLLNNLQARDQTGDVPTIAQLATSPQQTFREVLEITCAVSILQQKLTQYINPKAEKVYTWIEENMRFKQNEMKLSEKEAVIALYFDLVAGDHVEEVNMLFSYLKQASNKSAVLFDKNCVNNELKTALTIAVENQSDKMMKILLQEGVDIGSTLLYAIDCDFITGVDQILAHNRCIDLEIIHDHYFEEGTTPMLLAAHNNNYRALELLHKKYGHPLLENVESDDETGRKMKWGELRKRRAMCRARAEPAYIIIHFESKQSANFTLDPLDYCISEIQTLRRFSDRVSCDFYKKTAVKLEEFMCSLLDNVKRQDEINEIFYLQENGECPLLQKIVDMKLTRFISHQRSQEALRKYAFSSDCPTAWKALILGFFYPFLFLVHFIFPRTKCGKLMRVPAVSICCWAMSNGLFAVQLFAKRFLLLNKLGQPLHPLEYIIMLWSASFAWQELAEFKKGPRRYVNDIWNWADAVLVVSTLVSTIIRFHDIRVNANNQLPRSQWGEDELMLFAKAADSVSLLLVFVHLMKWLSLNRYLGPLIIALEKITWKLLTVLLHFLIVMVAFTLCINEIYSYYNTAEWKEYGCPTSGTNSTNNTEELRSLCSEMAKVWSSFPRTLSGLYQALFGLVEEHDLDIYGTKHRFASNAGKVIISVFLICGIIFMFNVLIAIVNNLYDEVEKNADMELKFVRSELWIRFMGRNAPWPLPMNLIPRCRCSTSSKEYANDQKVLEKLVVRYKLHRVIKPLITVIENDSKGAATWLDNDA